MKRIFATTNQQMSERERKNQTRSRELAAQGMVLLKNSGALPLAHRETLALYGYGARMTVKGGTGSGDVNSRETVNIEQGLLAAKFRLAAVSWLAKLDAIMAEAKAAHGRQIAEAKEKGIQELIAVLHMFQRPEEPLIEEEDIARECSTAIYVITRNSGEGFDRKAEPGDYYLADVEKENLKRLTRAYEKVVVVLNVGGVIDVQPLHDLPKVHAVLLMSQAGCHGGHALADVLSGKVTPSGHLAMTWARRYEDYPGAETFSHRNGNLDDEYYREGIYVGYRYFDTFGVEPAYPFGFGLSYTKFQIKTEKVFIQDEKICVEVAVKNIGSRYSGRKVVQVYYSAPLGTLEKPYQELAAFGKTGELAPGGSQTLCLTFPAERMASYNEKTASYVLERGLYYIRVGIHSRATHIVAALELKEDTVTQQLSNQCVCDCELNEYSCRGRKPYGYPEEEREKSEAAVLPITGISFHKAVYRTENGILPKPETDKTITLDDVLSGAYTLNELVGQMGVEELARLCVGASSDVQNIWGGAGMTGMNSVLCVGAAGDIQSIPERKIQGMVLADGPAGLRLNHEFVADAKGNLVTITSLEAFLPKEKIPRLPEDAIHYYQYCTAIPIATLLAQTWDLEILREAGRLIGEEMKEFGVTLWLAPGMNIQRNPLCGRNFEYYSEDPVLSGECAAGMTEGVQEYPNVGTTIKHFALNNQEDNRPFVNAHVSERAAREIYLKGFELAVRKAQPKAMMTSYNLVNGTHAANHKDLLTAVARDEWGFRGIIMTDWGTTGEDKEDHKYGSSSAAGCILAGNDLVMPGSKNDVKEIIRSVDAKEGTVRCPITLGDLQACAKRILNSILCAPIE